MTFTLKPIGAAAAIALSMGTTAIAQETDWWSGWDTNADGILSNAEFRTGIYLDDVTGQMDTNMDRMLEEDELDLDYMSGPSFTELDTDGDGMLTEEQTMDAIMANYDMNDDLLYDPEEMSRVAEEMGELLTSAEM